MKPKSDNPAEPFKKALAEATKAMANNAELNVSFTVDPSGITDDTIRLPQITRKMTRSEVMLARGTADAYAMRVRFHNEATHTKYAPEGQMACDLYEAMETARCEAMGARVMPGTAGNIDAKISADANRQGFGDIKDSAQAPLATAAGYLVRHLATGRDLPAGADNVMSLWRDFMESEAGDTLENINDVLDDQTEFARLARQIIDDFGYGDQLGDDPDQKDDDQDQEAEEDAEDDDQPENDSGDDQDENDAQDDDEDTQSDSDDTEAQVSMDETDDMDMSDDAKMADGDPPIEPPAPLPHSEADPNYKVFATEFDEEIKAEELEIPPNLSGCAAISTSNSSR